MKQVTETTFVSNPSVLAKLKSLTKAKQDRIEKQRKRYKSRESIERQ